VPPPLVTAVAASTVKFVRMHCGAKHSVVATCPRHVFGASSRRRAAAANRKRMKTQRRIYDFCVFVFFLIKIKQTTGRFFQRLFFLNTIVK
jgi:hypothetical protein